MNYLSFLPLALVLAFGGCSSDSTTVTSSDGGDGGPATDSGTPLPDDAALPTSDGSRDGGDSALAPDEGTGTDLRPMPNHSSLRFAPGDAVALDSVISATDPMLMTFTEPMTIELWAKLDSAVPPPSFHSAWTVIEQSNATGSRIHFRVRLAPHPICESMSGNIVRVEGMTSFADGQWHHLACTSDGKQLQLLVDGQIQQVVKKVDQYAITARGPAYTRLGGPISDHATSTFAGWIDELRLWRHHRSPATIAADMQYAVGAQAGLVGCWNMDEGSGTTLADRCGGNDSATLDPTSSTAPTWSAEVPY